MPRSWWTLWNHQDNNVSIYPRVHPPLTPKHHHTCRFPGNAAHHRCVSFCIEQPVLHLPQQRWRAPSKDTGIGKIEPVLADREADARAAECCTCAVEHTFQFSATKPGLSSTQKKKKNPVQNQVISKEPAGTPCAQPWLWQLAVGGWRQLAVGSWQLAVGGGWWWLAAVGGWRLVVGGSWQWLAVGGWSPLAVGGGWWLAVGGGWWLAVGGGWQLMGVGGWRLVVPWGCP